MGFCIREQVAQRPDNSTTDHSDKCLLFSTVSWTTVSFQLLTYWRWHGRPTSDQSRQLRQRNASFCCPSVCLFRPAYILNVTRSALLFGPTTRGRVHLFYFNPTKTSLCSASYVSAALPAFAAGAPCNNRSLSPACRALSSKPAAAVCGGRVTAQTNRQTDGRPTVT